MNSNTDSLCDFCLSNKSKYCCSRCHRRYCSIDCYKSVEHMQCSEQFFKSCVTQELLSQQFDESSKRKLLEILKRNDNQLLNDLMSEEDNEIEEIDESIESRFSNLVLNDWRHLWDQLSDRERHEFEELLKSGKIGDFVEVWKPWWLSSTEPLVTPLDESTITETVVTKLPELLSDIKQLNELISKPVSPSVCPAVVSTLFTYCYICRLFNGEYDSIESIETLITKCPQISNHINCDDLSECLQMSIQQIMTEQPSHMAIELLHDLKALIEGPKLKTQSFKTPEYVLRALSDLICILNKVKKNCAKQKRRELELIKKKLEFYLSWSVPNGVALLQCINQINLTIDTLLLSEKRHSEEPTEDLRMRLRPKTLIQEIN